MGCRQRTFGRREFLAVAGAGAIAVSQGLRGQVVPQRRPNIVVILADDLGYAGVGVQGCTDIPTPNIDSIAQNGIRLTSGYVSCPVCSPTRAGLMTGRYQQRFGHEFNPGPARSASPEFGLPPGETLLPERLKSIGYVTGMVGKWHLGYRDDSTPPKRGFDEFFGFLGGAHPYQPGLSVRANPILRGSEPVEEHEYLTDAFAREASVFIERHRDEPFFLYLSFNAVHTPLQATEKYLARFPDIPDEKRRTHAAMLSAMDDAIGLVLGTLRQLGLEENTLLFFLSDNGGPTLANTSSNLPLRGYKGQVYEGGIRVPFLVQWKGRLPAGRVLSQPVIALDICPTVLSAAEQAIDPAWKLDGVDLLPYLSGEQAASPHERLFWRFGEQRAIREADWKLVKGPTSEDWELYNLADDIGEQTNLAAHEPERVRALQSAWAAWDEELREPGWGRSLVQGRLRRAFVQRQFPRYDTDNDGKLTPQELPRPRLFQRLDINGDGIVTRDEAYSAVGSRPAGR